MAEAPLQAVRVDPAGFVRRRQRSCGEDLDAELRKGARDVGGQPRPFRGGGGAEQPHGSGKAAGGAAPSNCTEAASWPWPRSDDGSGWSGRCSKKLAVMIR